MNSNFKIGNCQSFFQPKSQYLGQFLIKMRPAIPSKHPVQSSNESPKNIYQKKHRSPGLKPKLYKHGYYPSDFHPYALRTPTSDKGGSRKMDSLKKIEDKIENAESFKKKREGGIEKFYEYSSKQLEPRSIGHSSSTPLLSDPVMNSQETETELRTSCPNIFKKIEQNSMRNTMNTKNIAKLANIVFEIKEGKTAIKHPTNDSSRLSQQKPLERGMKRQKQKDCQLVNGFQISKQLGKGKFGQVFLARHASTGFLVALKKIIKSKVRESKMVEQFKREIRLHSSLHHPNIVKFYGFFEHEENVYLILEYISGGTLFDYMIEKDTLEPREAAQYLRDTIEALQYMHDRSIAHRDIKPENIVLTAQKVAKLCDFGWSALVESSRTTYCGTFDYAPPEILERKNYDTAVDIWCIGVLAYEMLTGRVPFQAEKRKAVMQKIISVDKNRICYPLAVRDDAKKFIEWLVQKNPAKRPKCRDLLNHCFFVNNLKKQ